jgi:hypothetical protein
MCEAAACVCVALSVQINSSPAINDPYFIAHPLFYFCDDHLNGRKLV